MYLYRIVPWIESASKGEQGHPLFVDVSLQGGGRADNPRHYQALYVSESPQGAVGEAFGDLTDWSDQMFEVPWSKDAERVLVTYEADPPPEVLDLDDAEVLWNLNAKPTDVVSRDRETTRELALRIWFQRRWAGLRWWSWWRPAWRNQILWAELDDNDPWTLEVVDLKRLWSGHEAVQLAAEFLRRRLPGSP